VAACGSAGDAAHRDRDHRGQSQVAAPVSETPAAGICQPTEHEEVVITLAVDTAIPRCVVITPEQHLRIQNGPAETTVSLGAAAATLEPGESVTFDQRFGDYLAPGVHTLQVSLYGGSGPQLWLKP
jgi:hypothetical protein